MALEGDEEVSVETRLTKGIVAPPAAASTDGTEISALTGKTKEFEGKEYATEKSKKVAAQYVGTITTLNSELVSNDSKLAAMEKML